MSDFKGLFDVRDGTDKDRAFIFATFLKGLYYGDSWFSIIPKDSFMYNYKKVVESLLNKSVVKVACLPEDKDVLLGYSILSSDYKGIHYVFVKTAWRNKGIAKSLLPQYPSYVTHLTQLGKELMFKKFPDCKFNPFLM